MMIDHTHSTEQTHDEFTQKNHKELALEITFAQGVGMAQWFDYWTLAQRIRVHRLRTIFIYFIYER